MLSRDIPINLVLEQFADNPFLKYFYEDKARHAFTVELFFLAERHKQLLESFSNPSLFSYTTLADYTIIKSLLFAKINLTPDEYKLFYRIYLSLTQQLQRPGLIIYLHRPVNTLLENIYIRGRDFELNIDSQYLLNIQNSYFEFFNNQILIPVVIVNLQDHDFINNNLIYNEIRNIVFQKYLPGVHYFEFSNSLI